VNTGIYNNKESFQHKVIQKLRGNGVLISSNREGYKIPQNVADLHEFVRHINSKVIPMLERINELQSVLQENTNKSLDIVQSSGCGLMGDILRSHFKQKRPNAVDL
jgi:hypothetical protein